MIITQIDTAHLELIKIFVKANELAVDVRADTLTVRKYNHKIIILEPKDEESAMSLTYMGVVHAGVLNMLDDYLLKCGVMPAAILPDTIHRQNQDEKEERANEKFMADLEVTMSNIRNKNEHPNQCKSGI